METTFYFFPSNALPYQFKALTCSRFSTNNYEKMFLLPGNARDSLHRHLFLQQGAKFR